jgi:ABC-2 type transport system ATP-binding protein
MGRRDVLEIMARLRDEQNTTIFYSTHILDDVQRVSDSVAILEGGRLLAQAPIDELLTTGGAGGTVYELALKGESGTVLEQARARVRSQSWISSLDEFSEPGWERRWIVRATNESAAEENLLRLVLETRGVRVIGFGRKRQSLEEAFFDLIEKGGNTEA